MGTPGQQPPAKPSEGSQSASQQEDPLVADILHDCNITIGLESEVSRWKEMNNKTQEALKDLAVADSFTKKVCEGQGYNDQECVVPLALLRAIWSFHKIRVLELVQEELAVAGRIARPLLECKILFRRDNVLDVVAALNRNDGLIPKVLHIITVISDCQDLLNSARETTHMYNHVLVNCP
ncbi:hypothetical protein AYL99_11716 [Fonsecaea erecta]|uniref:Uncharacterized protein n=1 Tax=Fonsecaea erecta TaxID=1367422 RepID=A0A178Z3Q6_9EURO|nr:hypothetical protein AYL99_11716 [Fonsecaea erecta]OAP54181.1 hypothetical protein AYL99_11716 [Fonsecaea erecta]